MHRGDVTGAQVRRFTAGRAARREPPAWADRFADLYTVVLTVLVWASMAVALLSASGQEAGDVLAGQGRGRLLLLHPTWLLLALGLGLPAGVAALTTRLGPLGMNTGQRLWWASLPVDRRGLLRPGSVAAAAFGTGVGALTAVVLALSDPAVLPVATSLPGLGALAVLIPAFGQTGDTLAGAARRARRRVAAADGLLVLLAGATALVGVLQPGPPLSGGAAASPIAVLGPGVLSLVLAVAVFLLVDGRLERIPLVSLGRGGDATAESTGALASLDTRALGRALDRTSASRAGRPTPSTGMPIVVARTIVPRLPRRWRPIAVLVLADALILARAPRRPVQGLVGVGVVLVALALPGSRWVAAAGVLMGGWIAAVPLLEGARLGHLAPAVDALVPMGQRTVRAARLILPALLLAVGGGAVLPVVGAQVATTTVSAGASLAGGEDVLRWALLGVCAGPGLAAGALRGAYRPAADLSTGPIVTPVGTIPPGLVQTFVEGPDAALIALGPCVLAVLSGTVAPTFLMAQAALTTVVAAAVVWRDPEAKRQAA